VRNLQRLQKRRGLRQSFCENAAWCRTDECRLPDSPVEATKLVREDDAGDREAGGKCYLERIALGLAGDGARYEEPHLAVVRGWGQNESRPPASLFVTAFGNVRHDATSLRDRPPVRGRPRRAGCDG
jgi:hypothetical protein